MCLDENIILQRCMQPLNPETVIEFDYTCDFILCTWQWQFAVLFTFSLYLYVEISKIIWDKIIHALNEEKCVSLKCIIFSAYRVPRAFLPSGYKDILMIN